MTFGFSFPGAFRERINKIKSSFKSKILMWASVERKGEGSSSRYHTIHFHLFMQTVQRRIWIRVSKCAMAVIRSDQPGFNLCQDFTFMQNDIRPCLDADKVVLLLPVWKKTTNPNVFQVCSGSLWVHRSFIRQLERL